MGKNLESGPKTGEIVLSALKKLTQNTGWTARTITKFIRMEYRIADTKYSRKVSRALKRGVKLGLLQVEQGRYRLSKVSFLARSVHSREIRLRQRPRRRELALRIRSRS